MSGKGTKSLPLSNIAPTETEGIASRAKNNYNRIGKFLYGAVENRNRAKGLERWLLQGGAETISEKSELLIRQYIEYVRGCSGNNLFREFREGNALQHIYSHTCKHKFCSICQRERSRKLRRLYRVLLETHSELYENNAMMHVMLSVPHTVEGWHGKEMYSSELLKAFNALRKTKAWRRWCVGGMFNTEVTRNEDGLHIHLHIFALVNKEHRYRNRFYRDVLVAWNKLTAWDGSARKSFTGKDIAAIRRSLGMDTVGKTATYTESEAAAIIGKLNPKGSTVIHVQDLYYRAKDANGNWVKVYKLPTLEDKARALLECLKYNFKPIAFDAQKSDNGEGGKTEGGKVNYALMATVIPAIYGKRLYGRFGLLLKQPYAAIFRDEDTETEDDAETPVVTELTEIVHHPDTLHAVESRTGAYGYTSRPLNHIAVDTKLDSERGKYAVSKAWAIAWKDPTMHMGATLPEATAIMARLTKHTVANGGSIRRRAQANIETTERNETKTNTSEPPTKPEQGKTKRRQPKTKPD